MSYLIDTNALSETIRPKANKSLLNWLESTNPESLYISVLTLGEIRKGIQKCPDDKRKAKLRLWLENKITDWFSGRILTVDLAIADRWGRLQAEANRPVSIIDSLLAATALHHDLTLVTRNTKDFNFPGLEVFNPWEHDL